MLKLGRYKHYKGKEYEVLGVAKHSETLEDFVIYQALYGKKQIWVRPLNMFLEKNNYIFPVNAGSHAAAQIGSMIATNASGTRAIKYGKMEKWVDYINVLIIDKDKKIQ